MKTTIWKFSCDAIGCEHAYRSSAYRSSVSRSSAVDLPVGWRELDGKHFCPRCVMRAAAFLTAKPAPVETAEPLARLTSAAVNALAAMRYTQENLHWQRLESPIAALDLALKAVGVDAGKGEP